MIRSLFSLLTSRKAPNRGPEKLIFIIVPSLTGGGAEKQAIEVGRMLLQKGQRVVFLPLVYVPGEYPIPPDAGRVQFAMKSRKYPQEALRLLAYVKQERPDVILTFGIPANLAGRISKLFVRSACLITSIRTQNLAGIKGRFITYTKKLDRWTVYNSKQVAQKHCAEGVSVKEKVKTIYNAISVPPCAVGAREEIRSRLRLQQGDFLWGTIGRMESVKDHLMLINSGVDTWLKKSHFVIVGDGPLSGDIKALVKKLGLEGRVHIPGRQTNISDWCSAMDAFVLSSKWEGMPNGLLEAMNCGLPCVSTEVGGVTEVLEGGKNGLMVPPQDPEAISRAMEALMAMDLAERDNLATRGQTFIEKHCAPSVIAKQWCDLILSE